MRTAKTLADFYFYLVQSPSQVDQVCRREAVAIQGNILHRETRVTPRMHFIVSILCRRTLTSVGSLYAAVLCASLVKEHSDQWFQLFKEILGIISFIWRFLNIC